MTRPIVTSGVPDTDAVRLCSVPGCAGPHLARSYCGAHYVRWQRHGDPRSGVPVVGRVRGEATYRAAHQRVRAERGSATAQRCAECGAAAVMWAYDGTDPDERAEPGRGRRYSADPARYRPRCRSCQRRANPQGRTGAASAVDVERAARLYRAGASARGIGALLQVSRDAVLAALRAHGVTLRPPRARR